MEGVLSPPILVIRLFEVSAVNVALSDNTSLEVDLADPIPPPTVHDVQGVAINGRLAATQRISNGLKGIATVPHPTNRHQFNLINAPLATAINVSDVQRVVADR